MAPFNRTSISGAARRGIDGRFATTKAALRTTTLWGLSKSEQAPFAAAIIAFGAILALLMLLSTVGSILSGILPQVGGGIAVGVLLGYLAMGRRPTTPTQSGSTALALRSSEDTLSRR